MVLFIGPGGLCPQEALPVSGNEMCRAICKPGEEDEMQGEHDKRNEPLNLNEGHTVKGFPYSLLHGCSSGQMRCHTVLKLGSSPILFDEVQLAMVLWVEVADVPMALDELLKL